jgi:transglutaminase-like putative cysteine protease
MKFDVRHKTLYLYSQPVAQSQHLVHMSPRAIAAQTVHHHSLTIDPAPAMRYDGQDAFGNPIVILDIEVPHREFAIDALSQVETSPRSRPDAAETTPWDRLGEAVNARNGRLDLDVIRYRCMSRMTRPSFEIANYAMASFTPGRPVLEAAVDLNTRIFKDFTYDSTATDVSTPITEVFRERRGVCQDFAHLMLAGLRAVRVPGRYVSGYILTHPPPGQPRWQGADNSHAWISVWSPEAGWVDLDPTNGLIVSEEHVTIAYGRDYEDVSPISGVILGGGAHSVHVSVDMAEADSPTADEAHS